MYKFEGYLNHHPLGAFLLVPLSILFIYVFYKQKAELIISLIIGFGLLILSNLRAAYIGFITIVFITFHFEWRNGFNRTLKTLGIFVISIIIIALLINSRIGIKIPIFTDINNLLIKNKIMAVYRPFFNTRDEYIIQSIRAIQDRPILGFGANNFYYASMLHTPTIAGLTTNAHNLFLTIAVENGLPGLVIFLCIIYLLLRTVPEIYKERSILEKCIIAIFISLLVLFQFNFYSRIYFLFTMLFVCAGLIYKEKERITDSYVVFFLSGLIAILSLVVFFAKIVYLQGNPLLALQMYPIYADAYKEQIRKEYEIGNTSQVKQYLNRYSSLFYNEPQQLKVIANIYYDLNDYKNALIMYKQGLKLFPVETSFIMAVYSTYDKSGNPKEGESYIRNHIKKYDILKSKNSSKDNTFMKNWFKERGIKL